MEESICYFSKKSWHYKLVNDVWNVDISSYKLRFWTYSGLVLITILVHCLYLLASLFKK